MDCNKYILCTRRTTVTLRAEIAHSTILYNFTWRTLGQPRHLLQNLHTSHTTIGYIYDAHNFADDKDLVSVRSEEQWFAVRASNMKSKVYMGL
jgi:hypothetical protein